MFQSLRVCFLTTLVVFVSSAMVYAADPTLPGLSPPTTKLTKEQILKSQDWRNTMLALQRWLSSQQIYNQEEVIQYKRSVNAKVAAMTPEQMLEYQAQINRKLAVMNSPEAKEAGSLFREQLDLAAPAYAEKLKDKLPDFTKMTAAQMQDYMQRYDDRMSAEEKASGLRQTARNQQADFVKSALATQRAEANRAISDAERSGSWGSHYSTPSTWNSGKGGALPGDYGIGGWGGWGGYRW